MESPDTRIYITRSLPELTSTFEIPVELMTPSLVQAIDDVWRGNSLGTTHKIGDSRWRVVPVSDGGLYEITIEVWADVDGPLSCVVTARPSLRAETTYVWLLATLLLLPVAVAWRRLSERRFRRIAQSLLPRLLREAVATATRYTYR